ncbi:MAB_1171c family putative transporter [Streptomyces sp. Li-HN-5-11]|uniref:MAB_1171c family putative transporter n=1 Tax=Streptomyces sp. Li-HN-5-11 TaxID=3075432 RepID=UPI0028A7DFF1|nr:MAB_1171c family putative transporter [Streptomyces sp. Li-HN-5-11]WNM32767.1 MAB_1171c family putative transporter [Streptomyces sp. Li-HN-5-11]
MTSATGNAGFYACGIILLLVCGLKIPALVRRRHDMLLRAACLLLFAAGCLMLLAAPNSIVALNRLTGITNVAAPVVYVTTIAFSGASLLLIVNWRPAPEEQTRRASHWCVTAYSLAILAVIVLFWAGNAPVEQVTLFDAYYANTPCIREMIVTYLVAQGVAMMTASTLCWRWSTEVDGSLRAGLRILAPAYLIIVCYDVIRLVAVIARWTGHKLDFLVDKVSAPLAAPASLLGAIGFALPLAGPRIAATARIVRQLRQLSPLWRALEAVPTPGAIRTSLPWWRTPPAVLLTGRKTALYDAIRALAPYCDPAVRESAYRAALRDGDDESSAAVTADATMILVARERQRISPDQQYEATQTPAWRAGDLVLLSLALASPRVRDLHGTLVPQQKAARHE